MRHTPSPTGTGNHNRQVNPSRDHGKQNSFNVNKALVGQFLFMFAKATAHNTIILPTPTITDSFEVIQYDSEICNYLNKINLTVSEIKAHSRIFKFIVDGIPTNTGPNNDLEWIEMDAQLSANYPEIALAQVPVCMCRYNILHNNAHASMIITFKRTHTNDSRPPRNCYMQQILRPPPIPVQTPASQCYKYQRFGHPTDVYRAEGPTYGHFSGPHLTKDHP